MQHLHLKSEWKYLSCAAQRDQSVEQFGLVSGCEQMMGSWLVYEQEELVYDEQGANSGQAAVSAEPCLTRQLATAASQEATNCISVFLQSSYLTRWETQNQSLF